MTGTHEHAIATWSAAGAAAVDNRADSVLLLVGHPQPAVSMVCPTRPASRRDHDRCSGRQPEFAEWAALLTTTAPRPFLRYLPSASAHWVHEETALPRATIPSALLRRLRGLRHGRRPRRRAAFSRRGPGAHSESWPNVAIEGTRGQIQFSRTPDINIWQWTGRQSRSLIEFRRTRSLPDPPHRLREHGRRRPGSVRT